jgi:hypothetical protein
MSNQGKAPEKSAAGEQPKASGTFSFVPIYSPKPSDPTGGLKDLGSSVERLRRRLDEHALFDARQTERLTKGNKP